jgi:hypothetical protein
MRYRGQGLGIDIFDFWLPVCFCGPFLLFTSVDVDFADLASWLSGAD